MSATVLPLTIQKLVSGGEGLAFSQGKAVFVAGVLPGEQVLVEIVERRKDFDRGRLLEVTQASRERVQPPCPLAGICGGCDWLHVSYDTQLELKRLLVQETLRRIGGIAAEAPPIEPGPPLAYRNRVQVHRDSGGRWGYMGRSGTTVVEVKRCPVAVEPINRFFAEADSAPEGAELERFTIFGHEDWYAREDTDAGRDLGVRVGGRELLFDIRCFFQANLALLPALASGVIEAVHRGRVVDLYCGVGLFGAFLPDRRLTGVEEQALAVDYARRNAPGDQCEFVAEPVETWVDRKMPMEQPFAVIADPPRTGLGRQVREWIGGSGATTVVYVSCDPVTLARDLKQLVRDGLEIERIRLFDFFPQTSHVEALVVMHRPDRD